jgi:hypothetical protein
LKPARATDATCKRHRSALGRDWKDIRTPIEGL